MEKLKVIYVWDAYCGWCYGFDSVLLPFLKAHPELEILTISGGLFAGDSVTSLGELGFIKKANESITEFMGTPFGDAYNTLLDEGTEMLNSAQPVAVYSAFREHLSGIALVSLIHDLQKKFFIDGKSLSKAKTYLELLEKYGLAAFFSEKDIQTLLDTEKGAAEDFVLSQQLDVQGFPSLLILSDGHLYDLRQGALTISDLEKNYQELQSHIKNK